MTASYFQSESSLSLYALRSPTLPPATHTNCWVLGEDSVTLVDPGTPQRSELEGLLDWLEDRKVERIFLTHHHWDHISGSELIQKRTGAPIAAHPETAARVPFPIQEIWEADQTLVAGHRSWQTLHTPGHAVGHLCLFDATDQTLIAGDMVAGEGTILLEPEEGDLGDYLNSLSHLIQFSPHRLLPAHGPVLTPGVSALRQYIQHRLMRTEQIIQSMATLDSSTAAMELVPVIYPQLQMEAHPIAALQITCHLQWLQQQAIVTEGNEGQFTLLNRERLASVIQECGWDT